MISTEISEVKELTEQIIHNTFSEGDYSLWYSCLFRDSVFICNGEPMLIGDVAIRSHFDAVPKIKSVIFNIECNVRKTNETETLVYGYYSLRTEQCKIFATVNYSLIFQKMNGKRKILIQYMSYDYHVQKKSSDKDALTIDLNTVEFVRTLLLNIGGSRLEIRSGSQTLFVDPATILYVDSRRNKTEFTCTDRSVSCNQSIKEVEQMLPGYFYPLRRGNIVNLKYAIAIRRFELELISGIIIPIPEKTYMKVKSEISELISTISPINS